MKDQISRGDEPLIASIPTPGKKLRERAIKAFGKHKGNLIPTFTEVANDFDHMLAKWPGAFNALDVKATNVRRGTSSEALITGGLGQHNSLIAVEDGVSKISLRSTDSSAMLTKLPTALSLATSTTTERTRF